MSELERGYFATLGITFRSEDDEVNRKYKKLALKMHPDKNKAADAVDVFQKITTSYHIVSDPEKRKAYLDLYRLRCFMSQTAPTSSTALLLPHYCFLVEKGKSKMGGKADRLITFDLMERRMSSYKKDTLQKEFDLGDIASVVGDTGGKLDLVVNFKENSPYFLRARCRDQYDMMLAVLKRIADATEVSDEALGVAVDDAASPPSSAFKSKVIKKTSAAAKWQERYMVLGATHLLLFRSVTLENLVNIVPISTIKFKPDSHEPTCFQLVTEKWKAYFRVVDDETAQGWHAAIVEQQGRVESTLARGSQKMRHVRPSVFFTEDDFSVARGGGSGKSGAMPPTAESPRAARGGSGTPLGATGPALAICAPVLAQADGEHGDWLEYTDDYGRVYYYNRVTNETSWELPPELAPLTPATAVEETASASREGDGRCGCGKASSSSAVPSYGKAASSPALSGKQYAQEAGLAGSSPLPPVGRDDESEAGDSDDEDGEREEAEAQMAALRETHKSALLAHAEAREKTLAGIAAVERRLAKAKRCIESDRPVDDFSALWEQMRLAYDEAEDHATNFKRAGTVRAEQEREYMQKQGTYLNGLQSHMLGDSEPDSLATRIFKKCAFVADTFSRNRHAAL